MKYSVSNMADYVASRSGFMGGVAVVLGSGLGDFAEQIHAPTVIHYDSIPNYPRSTVEGHAGELVIGNYKDIPLIAAKGRFHYYEGYDIETITLPIQMFHKLGVSHLIITNAAGSARKDFPPGTLMAINGYMDCTFRESSGKPMIHTGVSKGLLKSALEASYQTKVKLEQGVYCWTLGPTYETPAEVKYLRSLGGDAVGMSTVPEIEAASELGMEALGISTLTNYAAGIIDQPLTHSEVIETADRVKDDFAKLLGETIRRIGELN